MNTERDKFITKALGYKIWDEVERPKLFLVGPLNFSTPEGFFKLKAFMDVHPNKERFYNAYLDTLTENAESVAETFSRITYESFANCAYNFLQEEQNATNS